MKTSSRIGIGLCIVSSVFLLLSCAPQWGRLPKGDHLERIKASPNFVDGEFRNEIPTIVTAEDFSYIDSIKGLFSPRKEQRPPVPLPIQKTDLTDLPDNTVVWLGHSSIFMRLNGKNILIDPVLGNYAAPFSFLNTAFTGDYPYNPESMPVIDYLLISHDHWDHLDYPTLMAMKEKIRRIICPLGVGSHLERWGFSADIIHEADWYEHLRPERDFSIHLLPARHFSGRLLRRNRTLWGSFLLESPYYKIFYSGDSGYGPHFTAIGEKFGPIDLAIMENGQYNVSWKEIHMMPEEAIQGSEDLKAKAVLPIHAGRFSISKHDWDEPYQRIATAATKSTSRLLTPIMGEVLSLENMEQTFQHWWKSVPPYEKE